jgi:hypothetical protein
VGVHPRQSELERGDTAGGTRLEERRPRPRRVARVPLVDVERADEEVGEDDVELLEEAGSANARPASSA